MDSGYENPSRRGEDPMAYGEDSQTSQAGQASYGEEYDDQGDGTGERGFIGDAYRKFRGKPPKNPGESSGLGSFVLNKLHGAVEEIGSELGKRFDGKPRPSQHDTTAQTSEGELANSKNRFGSFAAPRLGNDVKWFVDGCGYMWAVSQALERATHSVWILDCERSPFPFTELQVFSWSDQLC